MADGFDRRKLVAARLAAAELRPFLAEALYALTPVAAAGYGTFGVDEEWRLIVDPEVLDRWEVQEVAGVLLHEVGHVVRDHAGRARAVPVPDDRAWVWNLAGDAEINSDLLRGDVTLPDEPVTPAGLGLPAGKVAEYYYRHLIADLPHDLRPRPDCGPGCSGISSDDSQAGRSLRRLLATATGLTDGERILLRRRLAIAIRAAGRTAGTELGGWARWAEAVLEPVVDWRPLLRGAVRAAIGQVTGMVDYSYRRPSRRRVPRVVLPSMAEPVPSVAVIIDTSASMGPAHLNAAWTEVQAAIQAVGIGREHVTVLANDVGVAVVDRSAGNRVELQGGGGTDLRNGFDHAVGLRPQPSFLVVLTDGFTPWPDRSPPFATIVGLIDVDDERPPTVPPWAVTVRIDLDD